MEELGVRIFRAILLLMPRGLRREIGADMEQLFRDRHRSVDGWLGVTAAWGKEFVGALATAVRGHGSGLRPNVKGKGRGEMLGQISKDMAYAIRTFRRRPMQTGLAVITLALGIAASTAMFSVVDAVLLSPPPYPEPDRVVMVYPTNPSLAGHPTLADAAVRGTFSWPEIEVLREYGGAAVPHVTVLYRTGLVLNGDAGPAERVSTVRTTADLFTDILPVAPLRGRLFTEEEQNSHAPVILITQGFWERRFGSDPDIVGRLLSFGSTQLEVVGVLPERFGLSGYPTDTWTLMPEDDNWGRHSWRAIGRMADGITPEEASVALTQAFQTQAIESHREHGINVFQRHSEETRGVRGPLLLISVAALVLLLVACGNVAVLLLGAAIDREGELAVRGALGAGRGRLFQQLITESLLLASLGAGLGLVLTAFASQGLTALAPEGVPRIDEAAVNFRALGLGVGMALLCGLLVGSAPAWLYSTTNLADAMGTRGAKTGRTGLQGVVVVAELALATALVVGAGLLGRTVLAMNAIDPGIEIDELAYANMSFYSSRVLPEGTDGGTEATRLFLEEVRAAVEAIPGVTAASFTTQIPLSGSRGNNDIRTPGYSGDQVVAARRFVSANFMETAGIEVVEGRGFLPSDDRPDAPATMIISQGVADIMFPDVSPIGRTMTYWGIDTEIVGVVENISDEVVDTPVELAYYVPRGSGGDAGSDLLIRTSDDPAAVIPEVRRRIQALSSDIAITSLAPLSELMEGQVAERLYRARLVVVFSAMAAIFALMGIYGVTARSVAARTRELGIRRALGAPQGDVMRLVLKQALRLGAWGTAAGILGALAAGRVIEQFLWGVESTDPFTLVGTALLLGTASVLAALVPGRRASRIDPIEALRAD